MAPPQEFFGATSKEMWLDLDYQTVFNKTEKRRVYEDRTTTLKKAEINVGTLLKDMYDRADKRLAWTGRAQKTVNLNSSAEERDKNLDEVARKLLAHFPPK